MYHEGQMASNPRSNVRDTIFSTFQGTNNLKKSFFWIKSTFWSTPTSLLNGFEEDMNGDRM